MTRGQYSELLKTPQLWEYVTKWSHVFFLKTGSLLLRKIPDVYFNYDYIGAPFSLKNQCSNSNAGHGGFSLRNVQACLRVCEPFRNKTNSNKGNEDLFFNNQSTFKYPTPNSEHHKAFSVERVKYNTPVGCHQVYHCWDFDLLEWNLFLNYMRLQLYRVKLIDVQTPMPCTPMPCTPMYCTPMPCTPMPCTPMPCNLPLIPKNLTLLTSNYSSPMLTLPDFVQHDGVPIVEVNINYFKLVLLDDVKNKWEISCIYDYHIHICNEENTITKTMTFAAINKSVIHQKKTQLQNFGIYDMLRQIY